MADVLSNGGEQQQQQSEFESKMQYFQSVVAEKDKLQLLAPELKIASRLLQEELEGLWKWNPRYVDIYNERDTRVVTRVTVPTNEYPKFNFAGKLLGPKGSTMQQLQRNTKCKMTVLGRGSMKKMAEEDELRNSRDPKYAHLSEDLYVEVVAVAKPAEAHNRVAHALQELRKHLTPDLNGKFSDEFHEIGVKEEGFDGPHRQPPLAGPSHVGQGQGGLGGGARRAMRGGAPRGMRGGSPHGPRGGSPHGPRGGPPHGPRCGPPHGPRDGSPHGMRGGSPHRPRGRAPHGMRGGEPRGMRGGAPSHDMEGGRRPDSARYRSCSSGSGPSGRLSFGGGHRGHDEQERSAARPHHGRFNPGGQCGGSRGGSQNDISKNGYTSNRHDNRSDYGNHGGERSGCCSGIGCHSGGGHRGVGSHSGGDRRRDGGSRSHRDGAGDRRREGGSQEDGAGDNRSGKNNYQRRGQRRDSKREATASALSLRPDQNKCQFCAEEMTTVTNAFCRHTFHEPCVEKMIKLGGTTHTCHHCLQEILDAPPPNWCRFCRRLNVDDITPVCGHMFHDACVGLMPKSFANGCAVCLQKIRKNKAEKKKKNVEECCICLDDTTEGAVLTLKCGHKLHVECRSDMSRIPFEDLRNRCPMCRTEIQMD